MTIGDQVRIKTNGKDGTIIGDYVEADGTVHYKVRFYVPNSRGYGYEEEYGSFFLGHELEVKGG